MNEVKVVSHVVEIKKGSDYIFVVDVKTGLSKTDAQGLADILGKAGINATIIYINEADGVKVLEKTKEGK